MNQNQNSAAAKASYEAPVVTKIGEFDVVTQHTGKGTEIDATFAAHTPIAQLTLS